MGLQEGIDYYMEGPYMVFKEAFHLKRGHCCGSGCRHCPYKKDPIDMKEQVYFNWSGGKDSAMALYKLLQEGTKEVSALLTNVNEVYKRVSMHGVREELLDLQARHLGLPLEKIWLPEQPSMEEYELRVSQKLSAFKERGISHAVFGDIFLEDLRRYREEKLASMGFVASFPLWKHDTRQLIEYFVEEGFKTIIVCVDAQKLDKSFAGRLLDASFLDDLPRGVDPCGENGEFHTFCFDGPIFKTPVAFEVGETVFRSYQKPKDPNDVCSLPDQENMGFWFTDLLPKIM